MTCFRCEQKRLREFMMNSSGDRCRSDGELEEDRWRHSRRIPTEGSIVKFTMSEAMLFRGRQTRHVSPNQHPTGCSFTSHRRNKVDNKPLYWLIDAQGDLVSFNRDIDGHLVGPLLASSRTTHGNRSQSLLVRRLRHWMSAQLESSVEDISPDNPISSGGALVKRLLSNTSSIEPLNTFNIVYLFHS